jgi:hypothetical protein
MLPDRERWLGAAVIALISHQIRIFIGQGTQPTRAVKLYLKTRKPGVRDGFAPRFVNLYSRRPREDERRRRRF